MGPLVALMLMLSLAVLWAFFRFQPDTQKLKALRVTNITFVSLAIVLACLWAIRVVVTYRDPADAVLVPQVALSGALGLVAVVLGVGFILRNFVVFRAPRYF